MKNKLLFLGIFLFIGTALVAQPALRNYDIIKITDTKEDQPLKSAYVKIE